MGRRWTTNQYMDRYMRRMERRAFYRAWDNAHQPKSPDGTRKCVNCAHNNTCDRPRKGNHLYCFSPAVPEPQNDTMEQMRSHVAEQEQKTTNGSKGIFVAAALLIAFLIFVFSSINPGIKIIILLVIIIFALAA